MHRTSAGQTVTSRGPKVPAVTYAVERGTPLAEVLRAQAVGTAGPLVLGVDRVLFSGGG